MDEQLERLRDELAQQPSGPGVRYPKPLREQVGRCVARLRKLGWTWTALSDSFKISTQTLRSWYDLVGNGATLLPVQIIEESPETAQGITLVTPAGFRFEGLELRDAIQLMRALS